MKAGRRGRTLRVAVLNRVLAHFGLRLDDWSGRTYVLCDRKGRSVVVANLGALWVEQSGWSARRSTLWIPGSCGRLAEKTPVAL